MGNNGLRRLIMRLASQLCIGSSRPHVVMVLGKGGVGKTTVSILLAQELSEYGKTLLVSLDPAKHLSKYLNLGMKYSTDFSDTLHVRQVVLDVEVRDITAKYAELIRELIPSLTALSIDNVADVIKYSPGVEEEVFLKKLLEVYRSSYEYIIVDTPPTGITLRTLLLPKLYGIWLAKLIELRERIVSLRYVIARTLGKKVEFHDRALSRLYELRNQVAFLESALTSADMTSYVVVATPEPLPIYELKEVYSFLAEKLGTKPKLLVLNRVLPEPVAHELGYLNLQKQAIAEIESLGRPYALIEYLGRPTDTFNDVLTLREKVIIRGKSSD